MIWKASRAFVSSVIDGRPVLVRDECGDLILYFSTHERLFR